MHAMLVNLKLLNAADSHRNRSRGAGVKAGCHIIRARGGGGRGGGAEEKTTATLCHKGRPRATLINFNLTVIRIIAHHTRNAGGGTVGFGTTRQE